MTTATKDSLNKPLENTFDASSVNEELGAQVEITRAFGQEAPKAVAEFSQKRIDDIKADPNLSIDEKLAEIAKWDEGGAYRVAAHTAIGALGTGSLEGSLTTGSVAAAAPKISEYENKIAEALVSSGMSSEAANATSKSVTTLTLAGIGATADLDTSSTVSAINVDSNNRWLHDSEILKIFEHKNDIERFAQENNITYRQAWRAILAQAYRNTDDEFRKAHSPKPGTNESSLAQKAENFLRKHVLIASSASERKNPNLNRNTTKYKILLSEVERKTPTYSQTNKNIQVLKGVGRITAEGTAKGVGNIPSDTANGVAQIFGGEVERSFPYNSPESEEVGSVAQNVVGVATTVAGVKVKNVSSKTNGGKNSGSSKSKNNINNFGDYVLPTGRQSLDPTRTSFSQATVSYQKKGRNYNYDTIVADMKAKNGWIGDPVDVVNMPDRAPTSMDNTRVLAAREAGVKVEANVHNYADSLTSAEAKRFKYDGTTPTTWGEAIELRIKKQKTQKGVPKGWSEKYPNGSIYDPEVKK